MSEERALAAIARIEQALALIDSRIDAVLDRPQPVAAVSAEPELCQLREVHEALRGRVEGAIAQIDRLIDAASDQSGGR